MSRSVEEWRGANDDSPVPPRVRLRVFQRADGRCQGPCGRKLAPGDSWECDHVVAIINGGGNRESNLAVKCEWCHAKKSATDVAEKSAVYERALRHAGIKRQPKGRPMAGTRASGWKHKVNGEWIRR